MIDSNTRLYCIIGNPVEHSLSPAMHNAAFEHLGLNAAYVAFEVTDVAKAIEGIRALHICGVSVTIPHKTAAMGYLDEVEVTAEKIGAINTIVNQDGRLIGHNTDWMGAISSLEEITDIAGKRFIIVGAGGAARAIGFGIKQKVGKLTVVNRSTKRGEGLASDLGCEFYPLDRLRDLDGDVLIHTTPVGMHPHIRDTLIPGEFLKKGMVVMDTIYNPLETRLLKEARDKECLVLGGLKMLVYQGAAQFELWTGQKAPVEIMEEAALKVLT
jgi:shikimate dehydrogenase